MKELDHCMLCPRSCGVNRNAGELGYCRSNAGYQFGSICIHRGEEPAISGPRGICNVFFTGCNLQCTYCQNFQISHKEYRSAVSYSLEAVIGKIVDILDQHIEAVGFVTPTHFTPHVKAIINRLHALGHKPITVYNTNCYDNMRIIKSLEGLIDVYLPDFKYMDAALAMRFSDVSNYPVQAQKALKEMYRQKGSTVVLNDHGQAVTGLIIRHLVLPGQVRDSIRILEWIANELSPSVWISLMSQYDPTPWVANDSFLGRRVSADEYQEVVDAMERLGFHHGWIQSHESADSYRPDFSLDQPFGV